MCRTRGTDVVELEGSGEIATAGQHASSPLGRLLARHACAPYWNPTPLALYIVAMWESQHRALDWLPHEDDRLQPTRSQDATCDLQLVAL